MIYVVGAASKPRSYWTEECMCVYVTCTASDGMDGSADIGRIWGGFFNVIRVLCCGEVSEVAEEDSCE